MQSADRSRIRAPARALVVVDQPILAEVVKVALSHAHYVTRLARTGREGRGVTLQWRPQLVVVDIDSDGGQVLRALEYQVSRDDRTPVIALTQRGDLTTKLAAFESGVDDVLTVPFSPEELVARALVVTRRVYQDALVFTPMLQLGELRVDILNRQVHVGATELQLTSLEQSLLYLLAANAGRLITREEILDNLWGADYSAESNVVDRHVRNLRTKLHDDWRRPRFIATVPGRGYRFLTALTEAESTVPSAVTGNDAAYLAAGSPSV